ncbi:MAG TPA: helix-turn-helix transcriptional regulator [Chryseolinea sp.]|nr:helix-turn-helix transcriptional regulator [Chryseolinea sp.]
MGRRTFKNTIDREYQMAFGRKVRETRLQREWAQSDLAAVSNVSEGQISAIENGLESPRLHTLKALALAMGLLPADLLSFPFDLKPNSNFAKSNRRNVGATAAVRALYDDGFFKTPRSVHDVIVQCKKKSNFDIKSAETSGVLLQMVKSKLLKKVKAGAKNQYQAR